MKLEIFFLLLSLYLIIQFLFLGPVMVLNINTFFKKFLVIKMRSSGLIFPFLFFYAQDLEVKTSGYNKTDIVKVKARRIYFWINPFLLLIGKIRINHFNITGLDIKYLNRIPSAQKIKYMPPEGKIIISSATIRKGIIDIEDRTVFPLYKVKIEDIDLENSRIDLGIPLRLIFASDYAYCKIDSGDILSSCENGEGNLQVQGVTWGKLINLDILPIGFLKNKIDLDVSFKHEKNSTTFTGTLGQINRNPDKQELIAEPKRLDYKFSINWSDYKLPFDLGLKKMISQLLIGVNYGGALNITISIILENLSKILSKKNTVQSPSNQTEIKSPEL
jgi:hypothetical protein